LRTFFACADDDCRQAFGAAVFATFLHRLSVFAERHPRMALVAADPFGKAPPPPGRGERWRRRIAKGGVVGAARHLAARVLLGPEAGAPVLSDGHFLMQLRAADGFFAGLGDSDRRRLALARRRTVPDREILARFPRSVVPTYPGDASFFSSEAFRALLPEGWPVERRRLDEILHPSVLR
jgi:hypothetical protein